MKIAVCMGFVVLSLLLFGCSQKVNTTHTLEQNLIMHSETTSKVVAFDLNLEKEHIEPITLVVHKDDTVKLNFLMKKPLYISVDGYFNDYVDTGSFAFKAIKQGEFTVECPSCEKPILGYLIVQ